MYDYDTIILRNVWIPMRNNVHIIELLISKCGGIICYVCEQD